MKKFYVNVKNNIILSHWKYEDDKDYPSFIKSLPIITIEDNQNIYNRYSTYINGVFTENKELKHNKFVQANYKHELKIIQKWLFDNDWKVNKIIVGEWSIEDERWQTYLKERLEKRNRQDELNILLSKATK